MPGEGLPEANNQGGIIVSIVVAGESSSGRPKPGIPGAPAWLALGREGERFAAAFYRDRGASVVELNADERVGEIDLVAREPDGTMVFCEVKTRSTRDFGAADAVDRGKLARMRRAAAVILRRHHWDVARFDVLELVVLARVIGADGQVHSLFDAHLYEGVGDE